MRHLFTYFGDILKLAYRRKFDLSLKPRFINFLLTYKCNARCLMCNIWSIYKQNPHKAGEELIPAEIEGFLKTNKDFLSSLVHVGFTGGEPLLLRDDFVDIVKIFRECLPWAKLGVQTNGLNPGRAKKILKEIISFYPEFSLAVSIDGTSGTHSKIRGVDNAFPRALQTIDSAKQLGIGRITCGMTLTPYNYGEISQVKELVEGLGCEFSCFLAEEADYFNNPVQERQDYCLSKEQRQAVATQLRKIASRHYFMDNLRLILEGRRRPRVACFSGFTSLVIDPYGNVKPCILKVKGVDDALFGNIKEEKLESMLLSQKALNIKQKVKKCNCWCQCETSSSAVVFPLDVLRWFMFYCSDRRGFLKGNFRRAMESILT